MQSLTNQVAHIEHTQFALTEVEHSGNFSENTPAVELERINNELKTSFDSLSEAKSQLEEKVSITSRTFIKRCSCSPADFPTCSLFDSLV